MPTSIKHVIRCRCILTQFKSMKDPPLHEFVVFSVIDDDDNVLPKIAQCNNCGVLHRVVDICKSEILVGKESSSAIVTIDDISVSLPPKLVEILTKNNVDLPTWEAAKFIIDHKKWGEYVVISSESVVDRTHVIKQKKYLTILSENIFKIDIATSDDVLS